MNPKTRPRNLQIGLTVIIFALFSIVFYRTSTHSEELPATTSLPVVLAASTTYPMSTSAPYYTQQVTGTLEPMQSASLSFEVPGVITRIHARQGAFVSAGYEIATLDTTLIASELYKAQSAYDVALASYEQSIALSSIQTLESDNTLDSINSDYTAQNRQYDLEIETAHTNLIESLATSLSTIQQTLLSVASFQNMYRSSIEVMSGQVITTHFIEITDIWIGRDDVLWWEPQHLAEVKGGLYTKVSNYIDSGDEFTHEEGVELASQVIGLLYDTQMMLEAHRRFSAELNAVDSPESVFISTSITSIRNASLSLTSSKSELTSAMQSKVIALQLLSDAQDREQKDNNAISTLKSTSDALARAQVDQSRADLEYTRALYSKHVLRAPFSGVLSRKHTETGNLISAGQEVFMLMNTSEWKVLLAVPDSMNELLQLNDTVTLEIDGLTGAYNGSVAVIYPDTDPQSKRISLEVHLSDLPQTAKSGLFVRVNMPVQTPDNTFSVPNTFVQHGYTGPYVKLNDGTIQNVEILQTVDDMSLILWDGPAGAILTK